jgi:hypothetical protein
MGFRGVPDTTSLAGTSEGACCPIFPHSKYSTTVMPCKYPYHIDLLKKERKRIRFTGEARETPHFSLL